VASRRRSSGCPWRQRRGCRPRRPRPRAEKTKSLRAGAAAKISSGSRCAVLSESQTERQARTVACDRHVVLNLVVHSHGDVVLLDLSRSSARTTQPLDQLP
jgi:hypothetical protein